MVLPGAGVLRGSNLLGMALMAVATARRICRVDRAECRFRGKLMVTDDRIESGFPGGNGSGKPCDTQGLRPVILQLVARHGARRILCLGHCDSRLCPVFQDAAAVAGREPREIGITDAGTAAPVDPAEADRFEMVLCTEDKIASLQLASLVRLAAREIQPEGIFILSMPCPRFLKSWLMRVRAWWNSYRLSASSARIPLWSKQRLMVLLQAHDFTLLECIGIRDRAFRLTTILLVARKTDSPEPEKRIGLHAG